MVTRDLRRNKPELIKDPIEKQLEKAHAALRPIINLHTPSLRDGCWECNGCDWGVHAESATEWPCSTIDLIIEGLKPEVK